MGGFEPPIAFLRSSNREKDGRRAAYSTKPSAKRRNCGWPAGASAPGRAGGRRKALVHQQLRHEARRRTRGTGVAILLRGALSPWAATIFQCSTGREP